jgi:hypothetical protein
MKPATEKFDFKAFGQAIKAFSYPIKIAPDTWLLSPLLRDRRT